VGNGPSKWGAMPMGIHHEVGRELRAPRVGGVFVGAARILLAAALLLMPVALILGRTRDPGPPAPHRPAGAPMRIGMPVMAFPNPDRFVDPETGAAVPVAVAGAGFLAASAWSPWRDGADRAQLVGTWMAEGSRDVTLVRLSQPDGAVLDRISTAGLPAWLGAPCWFPDRSERLLLCGGDGLLYRLDFGAGDDRGPSPLAWSGGAPSGVRVVDLSWPVGSVIGGRALASLCFKRGPEVPAEIGEWSIWWLRLDDGPGAIVGVGPLLAPPGGEAGVDRRHPTLSPDDGHPALAWLEKPRGRSDRPWRLRFAPLAIDLDTGDPSIREASARTLAEDCLRVAPAFSADGSQISYVPAGPGPPRVLRVSLDRAPAPPDATPDPRAPHPLPRFPINEVRSRSATATRS
jgi:hypothetical protein